MSNLVATAINHAAQLSEVARGISGFTSVGPVSTFTPGLVNLTLCFQAIKFNRQAALALSRHIDTLVEVVCATLASEEEAVEVEGPTRIRLEELARCV